MKKLLVLDGDDTLWITEPLYDIARSTAGQVVRDAGFDPLAWESLQRQIDVRNVARMGLSPRRFPTSCVEALVALATSVDASAGPSLRAAVWAAAAGVFEGVAPLAPHARETLTTLRPHFRLALLTKGDQTVQRKRIADSGLGDLLDHVEIVEDKSVRTFATVVRQLGVEPANSWSIGNSLRSDILPALAAGLHGILVDAHVWEHEYYDRAHVPAEVPLLDDLAGLPDALECVRQER